MPASGTQLYAFEVEIRDIESSWRPSELKAEVQVFQLSPVLLQPRPVFRTAEERDTKSEFGEYKPLDEEKQESELLSFELDLKPPDNQSPEVDKNEASNSERPEQNITKDNSESSGKNLQKDGVGDTEKERQSTTKAADAPPSTPEEAQPAVEKSEETVRVPLKIFPEDPSGMPYYKVKRTTIESPRKSDELGKGVEVYEVEQATEAKKPMKGKGKSIKSQKKPQLHNKSKDMDVDVPEKPTETKDTPEDDKTEKLKGKKKGKGKGKGKDDKGKKGGKDKGAKKGKGQKGKKAKEKDKKTEKSGTDVSKEGSDANKDMSQQMAGSEERKDEGYDTEIEEEDIGEEEEEEEMEVEAEEVEVREYFEAGCTIMVPMRPLQMLHCLQRFPLQVRVSHARLGLTSLAALNLWPLFEAVLIAERGSSHPVASSSQVILQGDGDFLTTIYCVVKLHAFGVKGLSRLATEYSPNEEFNYPRFDDIPEQGKISRDIRKAPPMITSPEHIVYEPPQSSIESEPEDYPPPDPLEGKFFAEDIVSFPGDRTLYPKTTDDIQTMRMKIDRLLGLASVTVEEQSQEFIKEGETYGRPLKVQEWRENKREKIMSDKKEELAQKKKTRQLLKKILTGMNEPDPISIDTRDKEEGEVEEEEKTLEMKKLYREIQRQQREQKTIKYYKRLFRKMLRDLETKKYGSVEDQRREEKYRKTMNDLLRALENYPPELIEKAYVMVMASRKNKRAKLDPYLWPDLVESIEELGEDVDDDIFAEPEE